ncbi:MAG: PepSY domain-containing protein [Rhizobiaceae bacterium]|nr:PepSY domain-containing protein [Rhizobiaceae bacterium]
MMKLITTRPLTAALGAASALAITAGAAYANITAGDRLGTTEAEIRAALEGQGYAVEEFEMEDDGIEVEFAMDGLSLEAEIDPATGEVLKVESDDDDEDDGDD